MLQEDAQKYILLDFKKDSARSIEGGDNREVEALAIDVPVAAAYCQEMRKDIVWGCMKITEGSICPIPLNGTAILGFST